MIAGGIAWYTCPAGDRKAAMWIQVITWVESAWYKCTAGDWKEGCHAKFGE